MDVILSLLPTGIIAYAGLACNMLPENFMKLFFYFVDDISIHGSEIFRVHMWGCLRRYSYGSMKSRQRFVIPFPRMLRLVQWDPDLGSVLVLVSAICAYLLPEEASPAVVRLVSFGILVFWQSFQHVQQLSLVHFHLVFHKPFEDGL